MIDVTGVSVTPRTSTAEAGAAGNRQLSIAVEPEDATNQVVNVTTDDALNYADGRLTWADDTPAGTYTTTVTTEDGGHTDTHTLTLNAPPEPDPEEGD